MMKRIFLFIIPVLLFLNLNAQQQWKFHIAFEEATGQKDTIWLYWDSTAHGTFPIDTAFGEGAIALDYSKFNVWIFNQNGDTTKTMAYPFNAISFSFQVNAINYQYPLNIYWDSSLFSRTFTISYPIIGTALIDNDYFFSVNNDNLLQAYNMLLDSHAYAPAFNWWSQSQFPMQFLISRVSGTSVENNNAHDLIKIWPNPTNSVIHIKSNENVEVIVVHDIIRNIVSVNCNVIGNKADVNFFDLPSNFYFLTIFTNQNHIYHAKIIKYD